MKRIVLFMVFIIFLTGCNFSVNFGTDDKDTISAIQKEDMELQITKTDREAGHSIEDSDIYQQLNKFVEGNPDLGEPGEFMVYTTMPVTFEDGRTELMLLAVNRLKEGIQNIEFEITLGDDEEYIWEDMSVTLHEEDLGTIAVAHAMPFTLPISEEDRELFESITDETKVFKLENLTYDKEE